MGVALSGCGEQMLMTNQIFLYERQLAVPVTSSLFLISGVRRVRDVDEFIA